MFKLNNISFVHEILRTLFVSIHLILFVILTATPAKFTEQFSMLICVLCNFVFCPYLLANEGYSPSPDNHLSFYFF
jgi:hypothetical protein